MFVKLTRRINELSRRIADEFRSFNERLTANENVISNLPKRVSDIQTNYQQNLWSLDPEACYINKEYTVECTLVDKTTDHVKFSFQTGIWKGYYDLVLDNLLTSFENSLELNTDYVLTFEIFANDYTSQGLEIGNIFVRLYGDSNLEGNLEQIEVLNGWTRYKLTFRTTNQPATTSTFGFFIQQASFYGSEKGELHLRKLQLQKGSIPTTFEKNFNRDLTKIVDTSTFALKTEVQEVKTLTESKVSLDNNKMLGGIPTLMTNTRDPVRFGYYKQETLNRPTAYGNIITFSNKEGFEKAGGTWMHQLAFGTEGRIFYSRSIDGAEFTTWTEFVTSTSASCNVRGAGAFIGNNIVSRGVTGSVFWKRWCKFSVTTSPKKDQTVPYTHPFAARNKIISVSIRVDGASSSTSQGFECVITDTAFLVTNKNPDAAFESRLITFYVEYEP